MEGVVDMLATFVLTLHRADPDRARLRDLLRGAVGAAGGGAVLRRDRRRHPAGAVRAHRLARQGAARARVYVLVQQIESNVTIPIVMSQRTRMHPAMIAIGVVVVGQLFGFVGLFVAVPILSLIVIADRGVLGQAGSRRPTASAKTRADRAAGLRRA